MVPSPPSSPDGPGGLGSSFLAGARLVLRDLGRHVATDMPLASVHEESRRSAGAIAELPGACGSDWAKEWNSAHGTATLSGWKLALQSPFMLDEFSDDPVEQLRCSVVVGVRAREIRPVQIGRNPDRYVPRGVAPAMGEHIPRGPVALKQDPAGCVIAQMWRREIVEAVSDQNFWFGSRELARKEFGIVRIGQVHRSRGTQRSRIVTLAWPPGPVMSAAVPPGLIDRAPCAGPLQSRRSHPERNEDALDHQFFPWYSGHSLRHCACHHVGQVRILERPGGNLWTSLHVRPQDPVAPLLDLLVPEGPPIGGIGSKTALHPEQAVQTHRLVAWDEDGIGSVVCAEDALSEAGIGDCWIEAAVPGEVFQYGGPEGGLEELLERLAVGGGGRRDAGEDLECLREAASPGVEARCAHPEQSDPCRQAGYNSISESRPRVQSPRHGRKTTATRRRKLPKSTPLEIHPYIPVGRSKSLTQLLQTENRNPAAQAEQAVAPGNS